MRHLKTFAKYLVITLGAVTALNLIGALVLKVTNRK